MGLSDILKNKNCFKLVCGAGNEDAHEVEKLVMLYSMAGCNFFDISANPEIVDAAKRGLAKSKITKDRYICVSVGIKGDPHINKAVINSDLCSRCDNCTNICPQNAILKQKESYVVNNKRCIGCEKCLKICPQNSIKMTSEIKDLKKVLPPLIEKGIDCIEFHALGENEQEVDEKWEEINNLYDGMLSICIDRSKLGNEKILSRIKRMLKCRNPYTTIIQADGFPMSGGKDDYKTTLQAVAMAEIFQNENLPAYIMLSGGTNSKTTELATLCQIEQHGVAIGSFARKIVKEYITKDSFIENEEFFNKALNIAKHLVDVSLGNIK